MKILVTGAAGFIGSHLSTSLVAEGIEVVGIDNFDPFYSRKEKEANIQDLLEADNFEFVETNICCRGRAGCCGVFGSTEFDAIVHLAAKAGVRPSIQDPRGYVETNIHGTINLLESAITQKKVPKFIFASSSSVYGNNRKVPFSEDDIVDFPISPYAATKKAG